MSVHHRFIDTAVYTLMAPSYTSLQVIVEVPCWFVWQHMHVQL